MISALLPAYPLVADFVMNIGAFINIVAGSRLAIGFSFVPFELLSVGHDFCIMLLREFMEFSESAIRE